ncbi:Coq4 family protein [Phenylobacterium sp.]|uniref:Coq4 family protein n=1 Tax=Phenylobacterium sp. TaxID=1871053 RepID=UPI00286D9078|nr:Coq4 family protein [Phenylobacterium sp.]
MTPAVVDVRYSTQPMPKPALQWRVALKALGRLLNDKEATDQVFEIMRALNGTSTRDGYLKLLTTPQGGRIAYERPELADKLMDHAWLDSFAPGTVGAAYRDFIRTEQLSAEGLAEISREGAQGGIDLQHPYAWMGRRTRDVHDIWHILSGYHRDGLGEACLVAFSYAQTGGLGWALIGVGAAIRSRKGDHPYAKAIWQGYKRGKAAAWLLGEDYERLLNEPLEAARKRLNITPATHYIAIPPEARDWSPEQLAMAA